MFRRFALRALALYALLGCASGGNEGVASPPAPPPPPPPPQAWTLVWSDEFNDSAGTQVDTADWNYDIGDGCPAICGWGNNELEYYTSDTANIAMNGAGQLKIVARVAPPGLSCKYGPCRYTSAKITTRGKVSVSPGRVEARVQLPAGQGLWPAFWMLGTNIGTVGWPTCGELDIMEYHGSNTNQMNSAVHGPGYSGNTPFVHAWYGPMTSYHVYAVEWDTQSIRFFFDGNEHYRVARADIQARGNWVFDQPFYVILNQAVGGNYDGNPQSDDIFPATMLIDYVRVYTKAP